MPQPPRLPPTRIFLAFLALGLTSFGGPVAHIGYFREAFVTRRKWLDERGYAGALAAWLGFTAPSAALMVGLGYGVLAWHDAIPPGLLDGLKAVAVWGMASFDTALRAYSG